MCKISNKCEFDCIKFTWFLIRTINNANNSMYKNDIIKKSRVKKYTYFFYSRDKLWQCHFKILNILVKKKKWANIKKKSRKVTRRSIVYSKSYNLFPLKNGVQSSKYDTLGENA